MSSEPFDIELIIDRIKSSVPNLQSTEGAAEYAAITSIKDFRAPCAYVLMSQEKSDGEAPATPSGKQRALVTFGVVVVVKNYRDKRKGVETSKQLSPLVGEIRECLKGWIPESPGARPIRWLQGDVADYDNTNLLWIDVFQTQHFV